MGSVKISDYVIGIIVFTMIIVGGVSLFSIYGGYNSDMVDDPRFVEFNRSFNQYDNVVTEVSNLNASVSATDESSGFWGEFGVINSLIGHVWATMRLTIGSFGFMNTAFGGLSSVLGIPAQFVVLISLLVIAVIAYAIFTLIFKSDT